MKRNCICCEKDIISGMDNNESDKEDFYNPPYDATAWKSSGNFGSAVFDSSGGEMLEAYICDECLKAKAKYVYSYHLKITKTEIKDLKVFDPNNPCL